MRSPKRVLLILLLAVLAGLALRSLSQRRAFHNGLVYFFGSDAWCHMRRIEYAVENRLRLPEPDPMLNYPEGAYTFWGWLYDRLAAVWVMASGAQERLARERAAAWFPAVLGALCVIPAFFLGGLLIPIPAPSPLKGEGGMRVKNIGPRGPSEWNAAAGLLAAGFFAFLPAHAEYSMLGHLDHHVLESLLFGLLLASAVMLRRQEDRRAQLRWAFITSAAAVLIFWQHPALGSFYMLILWGFCLLEILIQKRDRFWWIPFSVSAVVLSVSAVAYFNAPPTGLLDTPHIQTSGSSAFLDAPLPSWLLYQQYSFFQPILMIFCALILVLAARLRRQDLFFNSVSLGLGALSLTCAVFLALPMLKGLLVLFRANPLLRYTAESMPILFPHPDSGFKPVFAHQMFGWLFLALPFGWVWAFKNWKEKDVFLLGITGLLYALTLVQLRFVYLSAYAMALALAAAAQYSLKQGSVKKWALLALLALSFTPSIRWWHSLAKGSRFKYLTITDEQYEMFSWLKDNTPSVSGFKDISKKPEYSIMASWDMGHNVVYLGQRAVVSDPLNHGMKESITYYISDKPQEAAQILLDKNVRYVAAIDLSDEVAQEMHAGSLELPSSHPARHGDWLRLFQMRLLMNLPIPGPDGHPFYWGHRLAKLSYTGKEAWFEFDADSVRNFKARDYALTPQGKSEKWTAQAGKRLVREQYVEDWIKTQECYPKREMSREKAFLHSFEMAVLGEILVSEKGEDLVRPEELKAERERIDRETQAPEILSCIKKAFDHNIQRYEFIYIRPLLYRRKLEELRVIGGYPNESIFFRNHMPKIPYRVWDAKLEEFLLKQDWPFLSALNHSG